MTLTFKLSFLLLFCAALALGIWCIPDQPALAAFNFVVAGVNLSHLIK